VFYCRDAFEGLGVMDQLMDPEGRPGLIEGGLRAAEREMGIDRPSRRPQVRPRSVPPAERIPEVLSWGPRVVEQMPLEAVFQHLSKNELFRLSWGAKNTHGEEWERLKAEFEARLARMQHRAIKEGWLRPRGLYGYWPAQANGDFLLVYKPETLSCRAPEVWKRFDFPRQPAGEGLCLADYFESVGSERMDVVAFQIVTVGDRATVMVDELHSAGDYTESYYTHGLAVQTAEACAEYLHRHIRRELGLAQGQGKRYSWGYPAIPDLEDHAKVFEMLPAGEELGMRLTSAFQLIPEQSTAAIIVHHPQAKYFSIGFGRVERLLGETR
jgi:5-methyltetrahydrofolate--homocysteine methyltransferase